MLAIAAEQLNRFMLRVIDYPLKKQILNALSHTTLIYFSQIFIFSINEMRSDSFKSEIQLTVFQTVVMLLID